MKEYFIGKYPESKSTKCIFPIIAKNSLSEYLDEETSNSSDKIYFIYSGNVQKWQKIHLMFNFIETHDKDNHIYLILSGAKAYFDEIINERFSKIKERFIIDSVLPEDLFKYYSVAHYGFLIRDDHILNRVANPTKMLEYLFYGITPIVKLKEIGDFSDYESESVFNKNIKFYAHKSKYNKEVAKKILSKNQKKIEILFASPQSNLEN